MWIESERVMRLAQKNLIDAVGLRAETQLEQPQANNDHLHVYCHMAD